MSCSALRQGIQADQHLTSGFLAGFVPDAFGCTDEPGTIARRLIDSIESGVTERLQMREDLSWEARHLPILPSESEQILRARVSQACLSRRYGRWMGSNPFIADHKAEHDRPKAA